jgi:hypothetical protein
VATDVRDQLERRMPQHSRRLESLFESFYWLKRVRDLYRLTVAAEDELIPAEVGHVAAVLGYDEGGDEAARQHLIEDFQRTTGEVARVVDQVLEAEGL